MNISERLDARAVIQRNDKTNTIIGLVLLLVVPAIGFIIGLIMQGNGHVNHPTFIEVLMGLSFLIGVGLLIAVFNNKRHPEKHSAFNWPEVGTPDAVLQAIEKSWNTTPANKKAQFCDTWFLTSEWLLEMDSMTFKAFPLRELIWSSYSIKHKYVNGIPTGTTRTIYCRFTNEDNIASIIVPSDEIAETLLFALQKRAPWSFYGHTERYFHGWHKERQAMIEGVRQRYKMVTSGQTVEQSNSMMQSETV